MGETPARDCVRRSVGHSGAAHGICRQRSLATVSLFGDRYRCHGVKLSEPIIAAGVQLLGLPLLVQLLILWRDDRLLRWYGLSRGV
jgi:hypothetical protein